MKFYLPAFMFMFGLLALAAWACTKPFQKLQAVTADIQERRQAIADNEAMIAARDAQLAKGGRDSLAISQFLESWEGAFSDHSQISISNAVEQIAQDNTLALTGKSVTIKGDYPLKQGTLAVIHGRFKVSGSFDRIMAWLQSIERTYRVVRIDNILMTSDGTAVILGVEMYIPPNLVQGSLDFIGG